MAAISEKADGSCNKLRLLNNWRPSNDILISPSAIIRSSREVWDCVRVLLCWKEMRSSTHRRAVRRNLIYINHSFSQFITNIIRNTKWSSCLTFYKICAFKSYKNLLTSPLTPAIMHHCFTANCAPTYNSFRVSSSMVRARGSPFMAWAT